MRTPSLAARSAFVCTALVCAAAFGGHNPSLDGQAATIGVIAGRVLDAASGQPISGAVVRLDALVSAIDCPATSSTSFLRQACHVAWLNRPSEPPQTASLLFLMLGLARL